MPVVLTEFVQKPFDDSAEWGQVLDIAKRLLGELNSTATLESISQANQPNLSSAEVQAAFEPAARSLGFQSEARGLFSDSVAGLRPDYFLPLGNTGIILEVERGKTTTNNMDMLDFWKCHLCGKAHYLFLLVPQSLQHNPGMTPKKEYETVRRRLAHFFEPGNYTNVRGLCLYGY